MIANAHKNKMFVLILIIKNKIELLNLELNFRVNNLFQITNKCIFKIK